LNFLALSLVPLFLFAFSLLGLSIYLLFTILDIITTNRFCKEAKMGKKRGKKDVIQMGPRKRQRGEEGHLQHQQGKREISLVIK